MFSSINKRLTHNSEINLKKVIHFCDKQSLKMTIKDNNLTMLDSARTGPTGFNSIEDLAIRNDVWSYVSRRD